MNKSTRVLALLSAIAAVLPAAVTAVATEEQEPLPHSHTVAEWTPSEGGHSGVCSECEEPVFADHEYDEGEVTTAPTCQADGVRTFTCGCGYSYEEAIPMLEDHVPGEWVTDETQHSSACIHCSTDLTAEHSFAEGDITLQPTCTTEGSQIHFCSVCGYEKEVVLPVIDHEYDEGVETTAPTCQADGVRTFTCGCGHSYEEAIPMLENHVPGQWVTDETQHSSVCIHCSTDLTAEHSFAEGDITLHPSCTTEGSQIHFCSVCGYEKEVALPVIDHEYDEGEVTTTPTCQADGVRTFTCTCGHSYEEVIPMLEDHVCSNWTPAEDGHIGNCDFCGAEMAAPHSYEETEVITPPTCQAEGLMNHICVCGHSYEDAIPMLEDHVGSDWTYDELQHSGTCIHCGAEILGEHSYDAGEITLAPTCQATGILTFHCVCGHFYEEEIPLLEDHVPGEWTYDEFHHGSACIHCGAEILAEHIYDEGQITLPPTCTTEGILLHTCTICGHSYEEILPADGHTHGDWVSISDTHHQRVCHCGDIEETTHNWDEGIVTTDPTCSKVGVKTYTCTDCGKTKTGEVKKIPHTYDHNCDIDCNECGAIRRTTHQYETKWTSDETNHWHECTVCGDDGSLAAHTPGEWIIDKDPEEFSAGLKHQNCTVCGAVAKTETIPATGCLHGNEELLHQQDPTCTATGYTGDLTCPRCQTVVVYGEIIPKLPHETQLHGQLDPTCTTTGYSGDEICDICQNTVTAGHIIAMLPHNTHLVGHLDPTCTTEGYTGDVVCQDCEALVTEGEVIELLPHSPQLHGEKAATCTAAGYTGDYICQNCEALVTEGTVIDPLPHTIVLQDDWDADCMEEGYSGDEYCTTCRQIVQKGHVLPKTDHRYEDGVCLDCEQLDPSDVNATKPNFGLIPDMDYEEPALDPMIIVCIVLLVVTGGGLAFMIVLVIKKK